MKNILYVQCDMCQIALSIFLFLHWPAACILRGNEKVVSLYKVKKNGGWNEEKIVGWFYGRLVYC